MRRGFPRKLLKSYSIFLFQAQVHLLGNVVVWYSGTISVLIYSSLLVFYLMRRRRLCFDVSEEEWKRFVVFGEVLLVGYLLHYLPYFFVERTLFLHHYLPAFVFKVLMTSAVIDHLHYLIGQVKLYKKCIVKYHKQYNNVFFFFRTKLRWNIALLLFKISVLIWICLIIYVFKKFAVLSYGTTPLTVNDILKLRWLDTWDFIIHKA